MKPLMQIAASDVAALTRALREALDGGPAVWPVPEPGGRGGPPAGRPVSRPVDVEDLDTPPAAPGGTRSPRDEVDDGVALVVETSGSTDAPKRVLLSASALRASAGATAAALDGPGQWLLALPAHYIAGAQVLVRSIVAGTEPVVLDDDHFDPAAFAEASARLDPAVPSYTSLVPVQFSRLVEAARSDAAIAEALRAFDRILVGGQATPPALIVDGLVELSGPMLADGYLDDPERTADAFPTDPEGTRWYRTGDLGELAHDGVLRIRGRADDVIVSGGVKVALGEVERAVRGVPGFAEAVAVRVPDPEWGERVAVVTVRMDAAAASDVLIALAAATDAARLTPAARPVRVILVDRMPLLASGKPDRRALEQLVRGGRV
jgi:O-succinylbenzoic acid--CoA ligase